MRVELIVNGFLDTLTFDDEEITTIHLPVLKKISNMIKNNRKRVIVLFAGPPGAGKSTTAALWEFLSFHDTNLEQIQHLSIDGFHFPNSYLDSHMLKKDGNRICLKEIKGAPETYNAEALIQRVNWLKNEDVLWPGYDRTLHDPVENQLKVKAPAVVIEGNWVLLNQYPWSSLKELADLTIFIESKEQVLKQRLIERKLRGGFSDEFVQEHYRKADQPNINLVMTESYKADIVLELKAMNRLTLKSLLLL